MRSWRISQSERAQTGKIGDFLAFINVFSVIKSSWLIKSTIERFIILQPFIFYFFCIAVYGKMFFVPQGCSHCSTSRGHRKNIGSLVPSSSKYLRVCDPLTWDLVEGEDEGRDGRPFSTASTSVSLVSICERTDRQTGKTTTQSRCQQFPS